MFDQTGFLSRRVLQHRIHRSTCGVARLLILLPVLLMASSTASAQAPAPQRVYGSSGTSSDTPPSSLVALTKNSQTGSLAPIQGSPFNERLEGGGIAVDGQGKFLFVLNPTSNDISMFQIDPTSGALSEVPGSPFATPALGTGIAPPTGLLSIATERSGQFVFVGYTNYDGLTGAAYSAVVSLAIDTTGSSPVLSFVNFALVDGTPIRLLTDSKGLYLYIGKGISSTGALTGSADVYAIQSSGSLSLQGTPGTSFLSYGTDYAIDPLDRFFYGIGDGGRVPFLVSCIISPVDGTIPTTCGQSLQDLGFNESPQQMCAESSGHFLYIPDAENSALAVYSIDQTTGVPTQVGVSGVLPVGPGGLIADPMGPYLYIAGGSVVYAFQVDPATGNLTQISGSPFNPGIACCQSLAITGDLPLPTNGPGATFFPSSATTFTATVDIPSATQMFSIVNTGNQSLTFTSISLAGANAASFSQSNTCTAPLAPNANCSVTITFKPMSAGSFTANLQVADNAAGSPQTLALSGTGIAPVPTASLSANSLSFNQIAEGATEGPSPIIVTNTGTGPLHVASLALGGPNPNDFSQTNTCVGTPVAVNATCTINVSFKPIAPGVRTATLTINDDAANPSQSVSLQGSATAPFQLGPSSTSSTSATVAQGQIAQYSLQLSPGPGFTGTVSLACSGAPAAAVCSVSPNPLNVAVANAVPFSVQVSTTGSVALPASVLPAPLANWRFYSALALWLVFLMILRMNETKRPARRLSYRTALCILAVSLTACGCGGGSTISTLPPVTPQGTYSLTITATANSLPPQTVSLTLTVN